MTRGRPWREIVVLAAPVVVSKLSFTAMGLVDTAMVGRIGAAEQGAVGLATTFLFTLYVFGLGLVGVVNTFVSQHHGAGRPQRCGPALGAGLRMAMLVGAVTLTLLLLSSPLFHAVRLGEAVADLGYRYLFFRSLGLFGVFGYWAYNAYLEGLGHTRTPMLITLAANVVNAVLDYVLILGAGPFPALGVDGAGLATAMSNGFMLVCFVAVVHGRRRYRAFGSADIWAPVPVAELRRMVRIGLPMGFQFFAEVGAFLVFTVIIGWLGDVALAANQVALRLMSISFMTAWGIGVAATTLVGRHQGEGRSDLAMAAGLRAVGLFLAVAAGCALLFAGAPGLLVRLMSPVPEVQRVAVDLLYVAALFQVFDGVNMVSYGALRGAGDTRWPLVAVVLVSWFIGIPLVYGLAISAGFGVIGAWIGTMTMIACESGLLFARFRSGRWSAIRVVDEAAGPALPTPRLVTAGRRSARRRSA